MWELLESNSLLDSGEDTKSLQIIRHGLNLKNENFWDNFISICKNVEALSQLLNVPEHVVRNWPASIKNNLEKIQDNKVQKKIIPTDEPNIIK